MASNVTQIDLNYLVVMVREAIEIGKANTDTVHTAPGMVLQWLIDTNAKVGSSEY